MQLPTFGALLSFAIGIEERAERFYQEAAERGECARVKEAFLTLARQNRSRKALLVTTRQENVTEMVLEPITDFDSSGYEVECELTPGMRCAQVLGLAVKIEKKAQSFYTDAAEKARHLLAGVARSFTRLGKEKGKRLQELEGLVEAA